MTNEQLIELKKMSVTDRIKKYLPLKQNGKITLSQYSFIVNLPEAIEPSDDQNKTSKQVGVPMSSPVTTAGLIASFGGQEIPIDEAKGLSQKARLLKLLSDKEWHNTNDIQRIVYGAEHLGSARIAARISDLKKDGWDIEGRDVTSTLYEYRIINQTKLI